MGYEIETGRLGMRRIERSDLAALLVFMGDPQVMYAWGHAFTEQEVSGWIEENLLRYERDGYSYFAAIERATGELVGVMGPLVENIGGEEYPGVAYILRREHWGRGLATEAARASTDYLFSRYGASRVVATIRPENTASRAVAERLGMYIAGEYVRQYRGQGLRHLIYVLDNPRLQQI